MSKESKKDLGQFFTTNYQYILKNLKIPENVTKIIEPFTGNGDLLNFIKEKDKYQIEKYDIEPKKPNIIKRDTIKNHVSHQDKFVITNPPYLARNKSQDKTLYDLYQVNDLYKCYLSNLINDNPKGGILIIPLNFWSSIRNQDILLRKKFLEKFKVLQLNIFEERVFDDTSYTVCSFDFRIKTKEDNNEIKTTIYPSKKEIILNLQELNNFTIGGEIYQLPISDKFIITRLTFKNLKDKNTNILVKCIDDNASNKISLKIVDEKDIYIDNTPNLSSRTYATLVINPKITLKQQKTLVENFNKFLNEKRELYHSLFLTNYRESKDIARKRISFDLVYSIVGHLLDKMIK